MWQGISVDNTRDAGNTLKMLRTFYGKSRENAVYDGGEVVVTPRQLEKIEKGIHKPSYENYRRLARQYGKLGEWNMPLLETDSADVLALRQKIVTLIEYCDCERAEWQIGRFRKMVNPEYPKVRQDLLFFDAILKQKRGGDLQECLEVLMEALRCTMPDFEGRDLKWWVYQREEIMIASNIGGFHRRLGNFDEAKRWYEAVLFSIEQNSKRTGIPACGYDIMTLGYSNYLGDIHSYGYAAKLSETTAQKLLQLYRIDCIQHLLYHVAWNLYEATSEIPERYESSRQKWRKAFRSSRTMAVFLCDSNMSALLEDRKTKYLE